MVDVNHSLKNTSERSRLLQPSADRVGVTRRGSRATGHVQGRVRATGSDFSSQGLARPVLAQYTVRTAGSDPTFPTWHCQQHTLKTTLKLLEGLPFGCSSRVRAQEGRDVLCQSGCMLSAVQVKETLLDEMEHGFWSARSQRRPVQPELRFRALGTHDRPERLRLQQLLPKVVPTGLRLR